jgi:acetyltransferase-like isoleucine patch superfamily enzyme
MREVIKAIARAVATVRVLPTLIWFHIQARVFSEDQALERATQKLSLAPGVGGDYMRRAFLMRALSACHRTATVQFGTIFSQAGARLDANVYVGPRCHLGLVHLERDVLLAAGVHIPSGGATHGIENVDRPIREQPGRRTLVRIGEGTWIGSAAVVLADVGCHSVIGAGSVVTTPLPDYVIAAGVPARVIRSRRAESAGA